MPEVCRFYGIVIRMYFNDHNPPHFHAHYSGHEAVINIRTTAVITGSLPARALGLVTEWTSMHSAELLELWDKARRSEPLHKLDPLP